MSVVRGQGEPFSAERQDLRLKRDQLGPAERARKARKQQRAIRNADVIFRRVTQHTLSRMKDSLHR
jgi:hypothetical protein